MGEICGVCGREQARDWEHAAMVTGLCSRHIIPGVGPAKIADPESMAMEAWGTERLGPGVWALTPSLNQPGALHAYIVLLDVPEPPPWA